MWVSEPGAPTKICKRPDLFRPTLRIIRRGFERHPIMMRAIALSLTAGLATIIAAGGAASKIGKAPAVTFSKDVAPILQKNCQGCHRPGEAAPMSLLTYQEVRPWATAIREAVILKRM